MSFLLFVPPVFLTIVLQYVLITGRVSVNHFFCSPKFYLENPNLDKVNTWRSIGMSCLFEDHYQDLENLNSSRSTKQKSDE